MRKETRLRKGRGATKPSRGPRGKSFAGYGKIALADADDVSSDENPDDPGGESGGDLADLGGGRTGSRLQCWPRYWTSCYWTSEDAPGQSRNCGSVAGGQSSAYIVPT